MASTYLFVLLCVPLLSLATPSVPQQPARFCTKFEPEHDKCLAIKQNFADGDLQPGLECISGLDLFDCLQLIEERKADLITLGSGEMYVAGKYHHLVPLVLEKYNTEPGWPYAYYSLVVVRTRDDTINSMKDLCGKKYCHTSINPWVYPSVQLAMQDLLNDSSSCLDNLPPKSVCLDESCDSFAYQVNPYVPYGKYENLCPLCSGEGDKKCSDSVTTDSTYHWSTKAALRCLVDNEGDVAFITETTYAELVDERPELATRKDDYRLLCLDGSRKTLDEYKTCNWAAIPSHAVVTSPRLTSQERQAIRTMFFTAQQNLTAFNLLDSSAYYWKDLLFNDNTRSLIDVGDNDDYRKVLGDYVIIREAPFMCERPPARWCTISDAELRKCWRMRDAFAARSIKPDVYCEQSTTPGCAKLIAEGRADLMTLDAGDIYTAGTKYGLEVLISEFTGDNPTYSVAVVRKNNTDITFQNLKGKKSCHPGIGKTAGWNVPVGILLSSGQITNPDGPGCNVTRAVGNFFSSSCAPGALNPQYNPSGVNPDSLCALCAGNGTDKCSSSEAEPFYGYSGAFRCMATGVGDVAFVKHETATENTNGKNQDEWARDLHAEDFELLCPDGTREPITEYATCNLAAMPSDGIVTGNGRTVQDVYTYISMLAKGQFYYGDYDNILGFRLFVSGQGAEDLLFSDSTRLFELVPIDNRNYRKYLGDIASAFDHLNEDNCQPTTTELPTAHATA